jgi:hypothetical protein
MGGREWVGENGKERPGRQETRRSTGSSSAANKLKRTGGSSKASPRRVSVDRDSSSPAPTNSHAKHETLERVTGASAHPYLSIITPSSWRNVVPPGEVAPLLGSQGCQTHSHQGCHTHSNRLLPGVPPRALTSRLPPHACHQGLLTSHLTSPPTASRGGGVRAKRRQRRRRRRQRRRSEGEAEEAEEKGLTATREEEAFTCQLT